MSKEFTNQEIIDLPVHEAARIYPMILGDEKNAMTIDIQRNGIQNPVLIWKDPNGKYSLADGRNRVSSVAEILKKSPDYKYAISNRDASGNIVDEFVPLEIKYDVIECPESQLIERITGLNMQRRALSSSQKAALTVISYDLETRYHSKEGGGVTRFRDKELVEELVKRSGTNRQYIHNCMKLKEESKPLLKKVAAGEMKIPNALQSLAELKKNISGQAEGEVAETPVADVASADVVIRDGEGNVVPDDFKGIFVTVEKFKEVSETISALSKKIEELSGCEGGDLIDLGEVQANIKSVKKHCKDAIPHTICPNCLGVGKVSIEGKNKKCPCCGGKKFVNKKTLSAFKAGKTSEEVAEELVESVSE